MSDQTTDDHSNELPDDHAGQLDLEAELRTAEFTQKRELTIGNTAHPPVGYLLDTGRLVLVKLPVHMSGLHVGEPLFQGVGRAIRNEAAAYEVAKILGIDVLVPVTVLRQLPTAGGKVTEICVQEFVPDAVDAGDLEEIPTEVIEQAAAFDIVIGQADRRGKNWLIVRDEEGNAHLVLIDHGFCFDWDPGEGEWTSDWQPGEVRSSMVDEAVARGVTPAYGILLSLLDETKRKALEDLLEGDQLDNLIERVKAALDAA